MIDLTKLYHRLQHEMGPSGWWPAETKRDIIAGAILVQNTTWENADKSLQQLKQATQMAGPAVADLSVEALIDLIRPSGFYQNKSKAIRAVFAWFDERNFDYAQIWQDNTDTLRDQLLALPGVGQETADVYLVYVFDQPAFIADSYTRRLFHQLGETRTNSYEQLHAAVQLPATFTYADAQEFHGLIDNFGKVYLRDPAKFQESFLAPKKR